MYAVWLESAWSHSYQILQYKRASRSHAKTGIGCGFGLADDGKRLDT